MRNITAQKVGQIGETAAAAFLRKNGYRIICRNFKTKIGELDIIAAKKNTLVIVEVKARTSLFAGEPFEAVDAKKRRKLRHLANGFLAFGGVGKLQDYFEETRIDIISVLMNPSGNIERIEHIKNAVEQ